MNAEAKNVLQKAISDIGYWRWWDQNEGHSRVEFGGVLLLDDTKEGKEARTTDNLALTYHGNAFIIFLDNGQPDGWFDALHRDELDSCELDPDSLIFDDVAYAIAVWNRFCNRNSSIGRADEELIRSAARKLLMSVIKRLEEWFCAHCTDDREHFFGVKIDTLDNPDWTVYIDIADTEKEYSTSDAASDNVSEAKKLIEEYGISE